LSIGCGLSERYQGCQGAADIQTAAPLEPLALCWACLSMMGRGLGWNHFVSSIFQCAMLAVSWTTMHTACRQALPTISACRVGRRRAAVAQATGHQQPVVLDERR